MPEEEKDGSAVETPSDGVLELSMADLEARIQSAVTAATAPLNEQLELANSRIHERESEAQEARVTLVARDLTSKGHSPATVTRVTQLLLADTGGTELTLSKSDGEDEHLSVTDVIMEVLELTRNEKLELAKRGPKTDRRTASTPPDSDDRPVDERAEAILSGIRGNAVQLDSYPG